MKITDVRVILTAPGRNYLFVKIVTDSPGLWGIGEATINGSETIVAEALTHIAQLLIGRDPQQIEDLWQLIYRQGYWRGGPIFITALAGLDMALWDIKGKQAGLPVYQLLGGRCRDAVTCYSHAFGRDAHETEQSVRALMEQGFRVIRAQVGPYGGDGCIRQDPPITPGTPATTIYDSTRYLLSVPRLFEHLRSTLGMEVELFHDVHEQLHPIEAVRLVKELEPYRLFFLEDPLMPEHRESWPMLRAASATPLAIGEIFSSRWDCIPLFTNGWIDFLRTPPLHIGGITEARKVMAIGEPFNVRSAFHGAADIGPVAQAASVAVGISISNFGVQEWTRYPDALHEVVSGVCQMERGNLHPNEAPGFGIEIDEEKAGQHPYQRSFMPIVRRADGSMHVY
ncbi:MAG: D-galactonate dehydratase family protein [Armatimonadetes bacterium]|nr:D-galactonate dehydratase family protein [Armatimonadota bacterium]MDE2207182.1 D-galactonate dehydratase family protein [Armatimonadota bacterium]